MTDPTTILREAIVRAYDGPDGPFAESTAEAVLATRIPQACQTCKGSGWVGYTDDEPQSCPDCPTIATLLQWGWNVATHELPGPKAERHMERDELWSLYGQRELLAELREMSASKLAQEPT